MNERENVQAQADVLRQRKLNYQLAANSPAVQEMLRDLERFCAGSETPAALGPDGRVDVERTFILLGRHEVWMRIQRHFNLSVEDLFRLATGHSLRRLEDQANGNA